MFCTKCGSQMEDNALFCGCCGAPRAAAPAAPVQQEPAQSPFGFAVPGQEPVAEQVNTPNEQPAFNQGYVPNEQPAFNQSYVPNDQTTADQGYTANPAFSYGGQNQAYSPYPPEQPAPKKGSGLKIVLILLAVVVVAVAAVVAVFKSGLFDNDTEKVAKALEKTGEAYADAAAELGMPDLSKQQEKQQVSQSISIWIEEMAEMPELEGFGVRMDTGADIGGREMEAILTPYYGSVDLLDLEIKFDDNELYIGSPELTGDTYYMLDLSTLGDDLAAMGAGDELAGFSVNFFDLYETMMQEADNKDAIETLEKSFDEFKDSLEIKKTGSETIDVNSNDVKCTAYHVVMDEEDFNILLDALEQYMSSVDMTQMMEQMYSSMGLPQDVIDEMEASLAGSDVYGELFETLRDAASELGTVELDVYLSDGYVMSVVYEGTVEGTDFVLSADFGGGKNYADDLSIRIEANGSEMALVSSGNHSGDGGLFTDETTFEIDGIALMTSDFTYDSGSDSDNLFWEIEVDDVSISLEGSMTTGDDSLNLRVDELSISQSGESLGLAIGFEYSVGAYEGSSIEVEESVEILSLSEEEMQAEVELITANAYAWIVEIAQEVPALQEMLSGAMY